ncbi:MAG: hypothetical protein K2G06_06630 [Muribaculaceae bacterium]|nr:hypothetical protein [Muribaculaceae bacterium]
MIYHILLFLTSFVLLTGCAPREHDKRLVGIDAAISDAPEKALQLLDSIDIAELTEADRYYYDFLFNQSGEFQIIFITENYCISGYITIN